MPAQSKTGKPIVCGIYQTDAGREVRCRWDESVDALIRSERAADLDIAHDIAAAWKLAVIEKGFTELPENPGSAQ